MIISASRRTDIPAYFAREFLAAIKSGFIDVPHPRNPRMTSRVPLGPGDVETIVFWTRDPRPLLPHLPELDARGYFYYFQFTLLDGPPFLDPGGIGGSESVAAFRELAAKIGPDRVVWRYDPIVLSGPTSPGYHLEKFEKLARALNGSTRRVMISLVDFYPFVAARFRRLESSGIVVRRPTDEDLADLIPALVSSATSRGMEIRSCAEEYDLGPFGVRPGKCVDAELISRLTGRALTPRKDPNQRKACGCDVSKDIGVYGTCRRGCVYCYASGKRASR